jgi:hypothetical protein
MTKSESSIGHFPQIGFDSSFGIRASDFSGTFPLLLPGSGFIMAGMQEWTLRLAVFPKRSNNE